MLTDVVTLSMKGGPFESDTTFKLFGQEGKNVIQSVLLYGRNGSGKSSIAKAFRQIRGESLPTVQRASLLDRNGNIVNLSDDERQKLFIFDEDFIYKNVKLQEDHLETIIMLGEAVDLTKQISTAEAQKQEREKIYYQKKSAYEEFLDKNNVKSPLFYIKGIENKLKGDSNWAGRERLITETRVNASVNERTYLKFKNLAPSKDKSELFKTFQEKLAKLMEARSGVKVIAQEVPEFIDLNGYEEKEVWNLLATKIDEPFLTEREKRLFALIQQGKAENILERLKFFQAEDSTTCPYCFQALESQYKESMVDSIEKVLNDKVKEHQNSLRKYLIEGICEIDLSYFKNLEGYHVCLELIDQINVEIQNINIQINNKIQNPYEPIAYRSRLCNLVVDLDGALRNLKEQRKEFNSQSVQTAPLIEELHKINDELAAIEIQDLLLQLQQQEQESSDAEKELLEIEKDYKDAERQVRELEAKRKNVHIAVDSINACLNYIFFSEDRLKIEYSEGVYKLKSKGKDVRPCDVSVGERNIIGLCYFFTTIFKGQDKDSAYKKDYILVLDDPVSSYDRENIIGMMSFLKYKLGLFLNGESSTKILFMTHDLATIYDAQRFFEELFEGLKGKSFACKELRNKQIGSFYFKSRQEYTEIVKTVYQYANGEALEFELVIGNMMRQMLEAFSTFEYRLSIEKVSTKDEILNLLPKKELVTYYKNLMYRLVLNGGSHKEEQVKTMVGLDFFSVISPEEKKRTAREILTFIYFLNPRHLLEHLKNEKDVEGRLNSWKESIERSAIKSEIS